MFNQGKEVPPRMTIPLVLYTGVLCGMMWRTVARSRGEGTGPLWPAAAGALVFGLSDSLIAFDRFVTDVPRARFAIMLTY
jgi:alkenylglycerophosphocholine/alkenylglycerophosphoethanolamine hydrolase